MDELLFVVIIAVKEHYRTGLKLTCGVFCKCVSLVIFLHDFTIIFRLQN